MSARATLATAARVLTQLRHDRRTIAMILLVPSVLMALLKYIFDGQPATFDRIGGPLLGIFPFFIMFLITSITMLRERTSGTLERLMTTPMGKLDLLLGYGIAFALLAGLQATVVSSVAFWLLDLEVAGEPGLVIGLAVSNAVLGMALGLFVSAFATTEFQAVQFMPAIVAPQVLLCGLLVPRERMVDWLETLSDFLPLTYAFDGLRAVTADGASIGDVGTELAVVAGSTLLALALGASTLRRRTA